MSEIDRVFARFGDTNSPATERREVRTVPQRGTRSNRTVEIVHVRSRSPGRVANPFDVNDDRANCLRYGSAIEPALERRELMTGAGCK
jgi:hypothetical protein